MEHNAVNTGSFCLFCYQTTENISKHSTDDFGDKWKLKHRFLTLVKRQMLNHIRGSAVSKREIRWTRNAFKELSNRLNTKNMCDGLSLIDIHFCKRCEIVTQQFCRLYNQIEQLKLELDLKIINLCKTMRSADKAFLSDDTKSNTKLLNDSVNGIFIKKTRKTLKQSFKIYNKMRKTRSFPKIQLPIIAQEREEQGIKLCLH